MIKTTIVIPAYNEGPRIFKVLENIKETLADKLNYEIVVIDDGSTDSTFVQAKKTGVVVLKHFINRDQGAALTTGTQYALNHGADVIVHFDADGQHNPADIIKLAQPIIDGEVEAVLGSRFLKPINSEQLTANSKKNNKLASIISNSLFANNEIPFLRRLFILGNLAVNTFLTGVLLTDAHNGLRAFSSEAASNLEMTEDRKAHATEYVTEIKRLSLSYKEIPVKVSYSINKKSQSFFDGFKVLKDLFVSRLIKR